VGIILLFIVIVDRGRDGVAYGYCLLAELFTLFPDALFFFEAAFFEDFVHLDVQVVVVAVEEFYVVIALHSGAGGDGVADDDVLLEAAEAID
jgi:hypothetical protein